MAILNSHTFENQTLDDLSASTNTSISSAWSHGGLYSARTNAAASTAAFMTIRSIAATGAVTASFNQAGAANFYFKIGALPSSGESIFAAWHYASPTGSYKFYIALTSAGNFKIYDSTGLQVGSTGSFAVTAGNAYFMCITWTGLTTTGAVNVYIGTTANNSALDVSGSGMALGGAGNGNTFSILLGRSADATLDANAYDIYWDDVLIGAVAADRQTAEYTGAQTRPASNGATMQWTGGTAPSDFSTVDDVPFNTATYIQSTGAANDTANFNMNSTLSAGILSGANIISVKVISLARDNVTQVNNFQVGLVSNGVSSLSTATTATNATIAPFDKIFLTDPNTSAAWTSSAIDAAQASVKEGSAVATRVAELAFEIMYIPAPITKGLGDTTTNTDVIIKAPKSFKSDTAASSDILTKTYTLRLSDVGTSSDVIIKALTKAQSDSVISGDITARALILSKSEISTLADAVANGVSHYESDQVAESDHFSQTGIATHNHLSVADIIISSDMLQIKLNGRKLWYTKRSVSFETKTNSGWYSKDEVDYVE